MAMLIAWHALNKIADPKDRRFSDTFLVVTPGITIRDRLRVLWPHDAENYYRLRDLVPPDLIGQLGRAKILITNFHAFKIRKLVETNKLTKEILGTDFDESPAQMVNRVCRELGSKKNIVVINAGGSADLPLPLAANPRGASPQGPANRSGRRRAQASSRAARGPP
ncbi:MAG: hypothetical protein ACLP9L_09395 [Thermoguttaceae bacterium]